MFLCLGLRRHESGHFREGGLVDHERHHNPHSIAAYEDDPEILDLQETVECGPRPILHTHTHTHTHTLWGEKWGLLHTHRSWEMNEPGVPLTAKVEEAAHHLKGGDQ